MSISIAASYGFVVSFRKNEHQALVITSHLSRMARSGLSSPLLMLWKYFSVFRKSRNRIRLY